MLKACADCGRTFKQTKAGQARCPDHQAEHDQRRRASRPPHDRVPQAAFRQAVLARDGYQCTYIGPDGKRCPIVRPLIAHHVQAYRDLAPDQRADPRYGVATCNAHDPGGKAGGPLRCSHCRAPQGTHASQHGGACPYARAFERQ